MAKKSRTIESKLNDNMMLSEKYWEEINTNDVAKISQLWVIDNVMFNRRREILLHLSSKTTTNNTLSLIQLWELLDKSEKITKAGVLKNLDILVSASAINSSFITTKTGRQREFTITSVGSTILTLCSLVELQNEIENEVRNIRTPYR